MAKVRKLKHIKLLLAVLLIYAAVLNIPSLLKLLYPIEHKEIIIKYGQMHKVDPLLLAALIKTESNFEPRAESRKGAKGLMQITPSTGEWIAKTIGVNDYNEDMLFDPETNIMLGSWYIEHLTNYYKGSFELVFAAYNGGRGNVDKWLKDKNLSSDGMTLDTIPFSETKKYLEKLKKNYNIYKMIY
ncbi:MAG TPA: lytic transglycosylase domain-containing protein [Bacillota bacterium]|nr:lytic transglycosylase domain-containing protein [Bacillota bacterium]HQJ37650.1 lytic transglycosylase domain-containing protein [Bacillota bacterium]HQL35552.1 lytic transglycosylase domain-containing protein [Bacillota bacterium]